MTRSNLTKDLKIYTPAIYRIRIQGSLEQKWSESLGGMQITVNNKGSTAPESLLVGKLADQAALSGVLNSLYDMHFPVLSVECLDKLEE